MKTDYKNINSFEVAVVTMIAAGFVLVGILLFTGLTPRQQANITEAYNIFDMHQEIATTASMTSETLKFAWNIPDEFYKEFYVAFTQVATLPEGTIEMPIEVAKEFTRNISVAFNNLSDQVNQGYAAQIQFNNQNSELAQLPYDGKIMGAMIEVADQLSTMTAVEHAQPTSLEVHYDYTPPKLSDLKLSFQFIKN